MKISKITLCIVKKFLFFSLFLPVVIFASVKSNGYHARFENVSGSFTLVHISGLYNDNWVPLVGVLDINWDKPLPETLHIEFQDRTFRPFVSVCKNITTVTTGNVIRVKYDLFSQDKNCE